MKKLELVGITGFDFTESHCVNKRALASVLNQIIRNQNELINKLPETTNEQLTKEELINIRDVFKDRMLDDFDENLVNKINKLVE